MAKADSNCAWRKGTGSRREWDASGGPPPPALTAADGTTAL